MDKTSQKKATKKYKAKQYHLYLEFYYNGESDLIEKLKSGPKAPYIKKLIREDLKKQE